MHASSLTPITDQNAGSALAWRIFLYLVGLVLLLTVVFAGFIAPYSAESVASMYAFVPPQQLHMMEQTESGVQIQPYVFAYEVKRDPATLRKSVVAGESEKIYLRWFASRGVTEAGEQGNGQRHLFGPESVEEPFYLLGTDGQGRDRLSQILFATRAAVLYGLFYGVLLVGGLFLPIMLVHRFGGGLNRIARWLTHQLQRVPMLVWRLLLLLLLLRIWPFVSAFALAVVRQPELLPSTVDVAVVAVVLLLSVIALFGSRRLVGWLFMAALWLWLLQPMTLPRRLLIGQSEGQPFATLILGLSEQLLALALLTLVVGPILILVLYHWRISTEADTTGKAPVLWRQLAALVLLVAAFTIPADLLLTTGGFSGWLSSHSFGTLQLDISNMTVLTEMPWLVSTMVPPVLLFGLLLFLADQWFEYGRRRQVRA